MRAGLAAPALLMLLLLALARLAGAVSPTCARPRLRKEIRDLSDVEYAAFTQAMNALKRAGRMDQYTAIHQQWTQPAHFGALFFAWHRRLLWQFETELLAADPSGALQGLPYFDASRSYAIFDPAHPRTVGNGVGCVTQGPFAGWMAATRGVCLRRALSQPTTSADPRAVAQMLMLTQAFQPFAGAYEGGQHATVHNTIGGAMSSLEGAPDDVMFYLHHAQVDRVWYARQYSDPALFYWEYSGTHTPGGVGQVTLNTPIPPWQDRVGAVTDVAATLCYDYAGPANATAAFAPVAPAALRKRQASVNATAAAVTDVNAAWMYTPFDRAQPLQRCVPPSPAMARRMGMPHAYLARACAMLNAVVEAMERVPGRSAGEWPTVEELVATSKPGTSGRGATWREVAAGAAAAVASGARMAGGAAEEEPWRAALAARLNEMLAQAA